MPYKRILTIQDISCIGQCSVTVALPVLSVCGHETCILPAAVLSTHTGGFGKPEIIHLKDSMPQMIDHWRRQGITFDVIYTGYLGSIQAIDCAASIMDTMLAPGGIIIVDPAMADHGKLYSGFDDAYAAAMKRLCERADIMLPNITEAAMMTGLPYCENYDESYIRELLSRLGGKHIVLTGVGFQQNQTGAAIRSDGKISFYHHKRFNKSYHGTGDLFAACLTGAIASGKDLHKAVQIASEFTCKCIENTFAAPAHWYGVKFETALPYLLTLLKE